MAAVLVGGHNEYEVTN